MNVLNIAMKELYVSIKSKRFWIVLSIYILFLLILSYSLRGRIMEIVSPQVEFTRLEPFGAAGEYLATPLSSMLLFNFAFFTIIGAVMGASLGADAINREIETGTIRTLLGHPVYRDEVINGKFLGNALVLGITIIVGYIFTVSFLLINGMPLDGDSILRGFVAFVITLLYSLNFLSISLFFSTLFRKPETSMLVSVGIAVFFTLIYGIIASIVANRLAGEMPPYGTPAFDVWRENLELWRQRLNFINPAHHHASLVLAVFSGDRVTNSYVPLGESLALVINNLSVLLVSLLLPFALAYVRFMTSDLR